MKFLVTWRFAHPRSRFLETFLRCSPSSNLTVASKNWFVFCSDVCVRTIFSLLAMLPTQRGPYFVKEILFFFEVGLCILWLWFNASIERLGWFEPVPQRAERKIWEWVIPDGHVNSRTCTSQNVSAQGEVFSFTWMFLFFVFVFVTCYHGQVISIVIINH